MNRAALPDPANNSESVVFIHGLWMTGFEMEWLRREVGCCGFATYPFRYPSVRCTPEENAIRLQGWLAQVPGDTVHFVAHSLGGIVLAHLFERYPEQRPGRVLMLGTPLNGSTTASAYASSPLTRPLLGKSLVRGLLGDIPTWRGPPEVGMIAGDRGIGLGKLLFGELPGPNDGTVAVVETRGLCVTRHLTVHRGHFGMLFSRPVADAVCRYLRSGDFGAAAA